MILDSNVINFIEKNAIPVANKELEAIKSALRQFFNAKSIKEFLDAQNELKELMRGQL